MALNAGLADTPAHLIQAGGANYDVSVLNYHLGEQDLRSHPMLPAELQGTTPEDARLQDPFKDYIFNGMRYRTVGYLLRTPQGGGHWISVLPPIVFGMEPTGAVAGVLCDSLEASPFELTQTDLEDLLTACALEGADLRDGRDPNAQNIRWGCFLVTDGGSEL
jgi:hypothetical protein